MPPKVCVCACMWALGLIAMMVVMVRYLNLTCHAFLWASAIMLRDEVKSRVPRFFLSRPFAPKSAQHSVFSLWPQEANFVGKGGSHGELERGKGRGNPFICYSKQVGFFPLSSSCHAFSLSNRAFGFPFLILPHTHTHTWAILGRGP